jgi:D-tyrosyl-tRNA(Tyr) deacylase
MILLLQRVTRASVDIGGERVAEIGPGLLVLVGFERGDDDAVLQRGRERLLAYRVFADDDGRMNRSLTDTGCELLLVPQFTLAADTRSGNRPGFSTAAPPEDGARLFDDFCSAVAAAHGDARVQQGRFGAHMQVGLLNDGPVTFSLRVGNAAGHAAG